jgi:uncharacterized membrane protein YtjA (UPF0391 family)
MRFRRPGALNSGFESLWRATGSGERGSIEGVQQARPYWQETNMLKWALIFLVIALIAGALGFGGIAGAAMGIAKFLFFLFLVLFVLFIALGVTVFRRVTR